MVHCVHLGAFLAKFFTLLSWRRGLLCVNRYFYVILDLCAFLFRGALIKTGDMAKKGNVSTMLSHSFEICVFSRKIDKNAF